MRSLLNWLLGPPIPDPAPGQIWRSENSGNCMLVHSVKVGDTGQLWVDVVHNPKPTGPVGMPMSYAIGLSGWRYRINSERRVLVSQAGPPRDTEADAARFRFLQDRFADMKFSQSERVVADFGFEDVDPTESLAKIVDAARLREKS